MSIYEYDEEKHMRQTRAEGYEAGHGQPSFDKQFARDWLKANPDNNWTLPQEIVDKTIAKYEQAYQMLTGKSINEV